MEMLRMIKKVLRCSFFLVSAFITAAMLTNCGGGGNSLVGLPVPPVAGEANSYTGKPANSQSDNRLWNVNVDHSKNSYSYNPLSGNTAPVAGNFAPLNGGFLVLLGQNGYQNGLALEIPGRVILLRPGDSSAALIFAVQQASCFNIGGNVKFLFTFSPGLVGTGEAVFGRIYASSNGNGSSWDFNNQLQYQRPDGKNVPASADSPGYPTGFSGACKVTNGNASVTSAPLAYFSDGSSYSLPTEFVINPAGFFLENQDYANVISAKPSWSYPVISAWGVSEPSALLKTSSVATAAYAGFLFEASVSGAHLTRPVGFGGVPVSGTVMAGGTFPSEDPTKTPNTNMSIDFGKQDPLNNGIYYLAKLTIPVIANWPCTGTAGIDLSGNPTCTYSALATVGTPEGKYAVILSTLDDAGNQKILVLFQQQI